MLELLLSRKRLLFIFVFQHYSISLSKFVGGINAIKTKIISSFDFWLMVCDMLTPGFINLSTLKWDLVVSKTMLYYTNFFCQTIDWPHLPCEWGHEHPWGGGVETLPLLLRTSWYWFPLTLPSKLTSEAKIIAATTPKAKWRKLVVVNRHSGRNHSLYVVFVGLLLPH